MQRQLFSVLIFARCSRAHGGKKIGKKKNEHFLYSLFFRRRRQRNCVLIAKHFSISILHDGRTDGKKRAPFFILLLLFRIFRQKKSERQSSLLLSLSSSLGFQLLLLISFFPSLAINNNRSFFRNAAVKTPDEFEMCVRRKRSTFCAAAS